MDRLSSVQPGRGTRCCRAWAKSCRISIKSWESWSVWVWDMMGIELLNYCNGAAEVCEEWMLSYRHLAIVVLVPVEWMLSYRHLAIVVLVPAAFRCWDDRCCLRDLAGNLAIWARVNIDISDWWGCSSWMWSFGSGFWHGYIYLVHLKREGWS